MNLLIEGVDWSKEAEILCKKLEIGSECLKQAVENKHLSLFHVTSDKAFLGIFLAKIDINYKKERECVICFAVSAVEKQSDAEINSFCDVMYPVYEQLANSKNCNFIRVHADRKGAEKLLLDLGFKCDETIYRKRIK